MHPTSPEALLLLLLLLCLHPQRGRSSRRGNRSSATHIPVTLGWRGERSLLAGYASLVSVALRSGSSRRSRSRRCGSPAASSLLTLLLLLLSRSQGR